MSRDIDADKLIEHIKDLPTWWSDGGGCGKSTKYPDGMFNCEDVVNAINNAPTADVQEVKPCGNCVHYFRKISEHPCNICKHRYEDKFEKSESWAGL